MTKKRVRSQAGKLTALGFLEVKEGLRLAAAGLGRELRIGVEKWEAGHLLEAFIADGLTMPRDEQIRRARRGQAIIERIRMRDEPGPPLGVDDDAVKDTSVETGNHCNVPRIPGRGKTLSQPRTDHDPAVVLGARPLGPKKR